MTHLEWLQTTATLGDYLIVTLIRLINVDNWQEQESAYSIEDDETGELSLYERLVVHPLLTKPTLQEMEDEWLVLKAELIASENARLAEVARLADLQDRWDAMTDIMPVFAQVVPDTPNTAAYFRDKIKNEVDIELAEARLAAIETAYATYDAQRTVVKQLQAAYDQLNTDVYAQMETVFGTNNADSATAYEKTWNIMLSAPEEWSSLGLKDDEGNTLDTDQKILDHANAKLLATEAYGKWRMQRIQTFRDFRASLGV